MAEIQLANKQIALVDDSDLDRFGNTKWHMGAGGYVKCAKGYLHRMVLNAPNGVEVDHINGNKLDNRRGNLRLASSSENKWNRGKQNGTYTSRFKGVSWHSSRRVWCAQIKVKRKLIYIGSYHTELEAARAYNHAARQYHGTFAAVNNV